MSFRAAFAAGSSHVELMDSPICLPLDNAHTGTAA